jgi:ribonuclease P protein component
VKRRLRELVRHRVLPLQLSLDVVIWAQRAAYAAPFDQLEREVEQLVVKLQLLGDRPS